jgi:hypothetical protein
MSLTIKELFDLLRSSDADQRHEAVQYVAQYARDSNTKTGDSRFNADQALSSTMAGILSDLESWDKEMVRITTELVKVDAERLSASDRAKKRCALEKDSERIRQHKRAYVYLLELFVQARPDLADTAFPRLKKCLWERGNAVVVEYALRAYGHLAGYGKATADVEVLARIYDLTIEPTNEARKTMPEDDPHRWTIVRKAACYAKSKLAKYAAA